MTMDETRRELLRQNHIAIVNDLEPRGDVLNTLYEDGILTENDLESIQTASTRKERCRVLLHVLPTRGPAAYGSFQRALQFGHYDDLAASLCVNGGEIDEESPNKEATSKKLRPGTAGKCHKCLEALTELMNDCRNAGFAECLQKHCCLFLDNVEPLDLVDQLFQDRVLNVENIERIKAGVTRRDRCILLIKELLKSSVTFDKSLKVSLSKKYKYISDKLFADNQAVDEIPSSAGDERMRDQIQVLRKLRAIESEIVEDTFVKRAIFHSVSYEADTDEAAEKENIDNNVQGNTGMFLNQTFCKHADYDSASKSTLDDPRQCMNISMATCPFPCAELDDSMKISHTKILLTENHTNVANGTVLEQGLDEVDAVIGTRANLSHSIGHNCDTISSTAHIDDDTVQAKYVSTNPDARVTKTSVVNFPDHRLAKNSDTGLHARKQFVNETSVHRREGSGYDMPEDNDNTKRNKMAVQQMDTCNEIVTKPVTSCSYLRRSRRLSTAFNYLSTLINQGDFVKFENVSCRLQHRFHDNYDMLCILGYLHASRDLFRTEFDSAKKHINFAMEKVSKTSNPRYFMLELFTAKTRMYVSQKKLEKMQNILDEALMIFETDPVGLTGRAAGWLYINDARSKTAQITCLNLSKPNALQVYDRLFARAKSSFQRSMTNFLRDGGKDGPFGFGYALCRLVILLMRCGDNGLTMNDPRLSPSAEDIEMSGSHIEYLENSDIAIPKIMDMHLRLAKCDYHFRRQNTTRAFEHAQIAYDIASELNMLEFKEHAHNRVRYLSSRQPIQTSVTEITDEEANRILFGESSSSSSELEDT